MGEKELETPILTQKIDQQDDAKLDQKSIFPVERESPIPVETEKSGSNVVENSESESSSSIDMKKDLKIPILTDKVVEKDNAKLDEASFITIEKQTVIPVTTEKCDPEVIENSEAETVSSIDIKKDLETPNATKTIVQQDDAKLDQASIITAEKESLTLVATKKSDSDVDKKTESES